MSQTPTKTYLADLINPEVLADMIQGKLENAVRFANTVAEMDFTLTNRPGDTITIPNWAFIGLAADLNEGVADTPVVLEASSTTATVKKAAKSVELTDEAVLSGYGDPMGEAARQLALAISGKVDADVLVALKEATQAYGDGTNEIDYAGVVGATMVFADEELGERKFLIVNPTQYGELLLDDKFIVAAPEVVRTGIVGFIAGCDVIVSKQLEDGEAVLAKPGAVKVYMKRAVNVEMDRNILAKTNIIAADEHYVAYLYDESKVVICDFAAQGS